MSQKYHNKLIQFHDKSFYCVRFADRNKSVVYLDYRLDVVPSSVLQQLVETIKTKYTQLLKRLSFQPVLHDWCNKGRGICYSLCGMVHIKEPLLLIEKE